MPQMVYNPYATANVGMPLSSPVIPSPLDEWETARSQLNQDYSQFDVSAQSRLNELNKQTEALQRGLDTGRITSSEFENEINNLFQRAEQYNWQAHVKPPGDQPGDVYEQNGVQLIRKADGDVEVLGFTPDYIQKNTVKLDDDGSLAVPVRPGEYKVVERSAAQQMKEIAETRKKVAEQIATMHGLATEQGQQPPTPTFTPLPGNVAQKLASDEELTPQEAAQLVEEYSKHGKTPSSMAADIKARQDAYKIVQQQQSIVDPRLDFSSQLVSAAQLAKPITAGTKEEMNLNYGDRPEGTVVELADGRRYVKQAGQFWQVPWSKKDIESPYMLDQFGKPIIDRSQVSMQFPYGTPVPGIVAQLDQGKSGMVFPTTPPGTTGPPIRRDAPEPQTLPEPTLPTPVPTVSHPPVRREAPETPDLTGIQNQLQTWWKDPQLTARIEKPKIVRTATEAKQLSDRAIFQHPNGKLYIKVGEQAIEIPKRPVIQSTEPDFRSMSAFRFST